MTRYLLLTRHGEADITLTEAGRCQAVLLGERLRDVPLSAIHHGPADRTTETAALIAGQLDNVPVRVAEAAGDYVPYAPSREELPPDSADLLLGFVNQFEADPELAQQALRAFTGPTEQDTYELLVTHNFLIGWLVARAQDAPEWRWLTLNHCNAALTVIKYSPARAAALLMVNDQAHLPAALRWTGFPPGLRL